MRATVVLLLVLLGAAGATQETSRHPAQHPRAGASAVPDKTPAASPADLDALAADLGRMRAILRQMEMNMGFLPAGATPEKHQFELEVEMWRALLDHMEHHLQAMRAQTSRKQ